MSYRVSLTDINLLIIKGDNKMDLFDYLFKTAAESLDEIETCTSVSYPKYNTIAIDKDTRRIEFALAGWKKNEITIEVGENYVLVKGEKPNVQEPEYLHKGIATRNFNFKMSLPQYWHAQEPTLEDGILSIKFSHEIPEEAKPKILQIK